MVKGKKGIEGQIMPEFPVLLLQQNVVNAILKSSPIYCKMKKELEEEQCQCSKGTIPWKNYIRN